MKLKLPAAIMSVGDVEAAAIEIKEHLRALSHQRVKAKVSGRTETAANDEQVLSDTTTELIAQCSRAAEPTVAELEKLLQALNHLAAHAPQLHITLAGPPTTGLKKKLVGWCREQLGPTALVNFQFNSTLLGGMVVRVGSRIFDWSFRRQILAERAKFAEVLRRV